MKEHIYHEDLEGSVSWKTADTGESIPVYGSARETFPVWLLCPDGRKIKEDCYRGDCIFGGENVYALLAQWNWQEQCTGDTEKDIELGRMNTWKFRDEIEFGIKLVKKQDLNYQDVDASEVCEYDGWDYDIENLPENCEEFNKYSEDKVMEYFHGLAQGTFYRHWTEDV